MPPSDPTETSSSESEKFGVGARVETPDVGRDYARRDLDPDERVSTAAAMLIADVTDTDPTDLTPPMTEALDPEALDRLFDRAEPGSDVRVEFELYGCRVTVDGDRRIGVRRIG